MFGVCIFYVLKEVPYVHQGCIYLIKNAAKTVILWKIITSLISCYIFEYIVKCNLFLWSKPIFQHH